MNLKTEYELLKEAWDKMLDELFEELYNSKFAKWLRKVIHHED